MIRPAIVYVDTVSVGLSSRVAAAAAERGIATVLIAPPGSSGHAVTETIETGDFSTGNLRRLLRRLDRTYDVRGIASSYGPFREEGFVYGAVATLAAERGLASSPVAALEAATNKYLARRCLARAGVPDVAHALATDERSLLEAARAIGYPLVLKPLTGVGSSLILKCCSDEEAVANFRRAMRALPRAYYEQLRMAPHRVTTADGEELSFDPVRSMLVEQYLDGREASVECLALEDEVIPLVVNDKVSVEERPSVVLEHVLIAPPSRFTPAEVRRMKRHAAGVVRAIGLRNTFCHVELRYVAEGPRLLELNPRVGASCVTQSIETFTTLDVDATRVSLILGERPAPFRRRRARRHAMIFLFSPHRGTLTHFSGLERVGELPGVHTVLASCDVGERVGGDDEEIFLAGIWMRADDAAAAVRAHRKIQEMVRIRVR